MANNKEPVTDESTRRERIIGNVADMFLARFQRSLTSRITSRWHNSQVLSIVENLWRKGGVLRIPIKFMAINSTGESGAVIRQKQFIVDKLSISLFDIPQAKTLLENLDEGSPLWERKVVPELTRELSRKIERDALNEVAKGRHAIYVDGKIANGDIGAWAEARKILQEAEAPGMICESKMMGAGKEWVVLLSTKAGVSVIGSRTEHVRDLWPGGAINFECIGSNDLPKYKTGTRTGKPRVIGVPPSSKTTDNSRSIVIGGIGDGHTMLKGERFTIEGVNAVKGHSCSDAGRLFMFQVAEDAIADSSGITVQLVEEINDGNLTEDGEDVGAFKNVSAYPADNARVAFIGEPSAKKNIAVIVHPNAIEYCPISIPESSNAHFSKIFPDDETGVSVTVTAYYDQHNHKDDYKYMMAWAIGMVDPNCVLTLILDDV